MRLAFIGLVLAIVSGCAVMKTIEVSDETVMATCGTCVNEMTGDDCFLSITFNGKKYIVDGSTIDGHGDAHAVDGMCNVQRKAIVTGTIKSGVFYATSFELIK